MAKGQKENIKAANVDIMTNVNEILSCLTSCCSTKIFLENIHSILRNIAYADNFYIVLKDTDNNISFPYFTDTKDSFTKDELNQLKIDDLKSTLTNFALKTNKPCNFINSDIVEMQNNGDINLIGTVPEQWLCFPLTNKGQALGAFVIQSYRNSSEYSCSVVEVLLALSHVISSALDAFSKQQKLKLANEELNSHRDKLGLLVMERTSELKLEKEKLEVEVKSRKEAQVNLERNIKTLQIEIKENERLQKTLEFEATHDSLTGLANRKALFNAINRIKARNKRSEVSKQELFILYLDLDGFKVINDTFGHEAGDKVLIKIGQRVLPHIREYDLIARVGGDEFVILIEGADSNDSVHLIAERIIKDIERPIDIDTQKVCLSVSIGIASSNAPYHIESKLLGNADKAMYQAKKHGNGNVVWFKEDM